MAVASCDVTLTS